MDGMATSQVILPGQIVPTYGGGVSWSMMEGLALLGPPNCPASWPATLVEWVSADPTNKATPVGLTTPVKHDTSPGSGKGKLPLGSSGKKSVPPKQVIDYWDHPERDKEDEESCRWEEERHQKKMNTRNRFCFLLPKLFQVGYPRYPDCLPVPLPKAREAEARSNGPVQSGSTLQMMSHSWTKEVNQSPKAGRGTTLPQI